MVPRKSKSEERRQSYEQLNIQKFVVPTLLRPNCFFRFYFILFHFFSLAGLNFYFRTNSLYVSMIVPCGCSMHLLLCFIFSSFVHFCLFVQCSPHVTAVFSFILRHARVTWESKRKRKKLCAPAAVATYNRISSTCDCNENDFLCMGWALLVNNISSQSIFERKSVAKLYKHKPNSKICIRVSVWTVTAVHTRERMKKSSERKWTKKKPICHKCECRISKRMRNELGHNLLKSNRRLWLNI